MLDRSHTLVDSLNKHHGDDHYRLELRRIGRSSRPKPEAPTEEGATNIIAESIGGLEVSDQKTVRAHIQSLERQNTDLHRDVDSLKVKLMKHNDLQDQLLELHKQNTMLKEKYQDKQTAYKKDVQHLQEKLDEASLAQRKLEEQILVLKEMSLALEASGVEAAQSKSVLEQIQQKYGEEVKNLTGELRVKDRNLQETRSKRITMVSYDFHFLLCLLFFSSRNLS